MLRPISADDPEARSADVVAENVERLRALFPEAFLGGGGIDFPVLKQLLGGAVDEREEKYGLTWHGKRQARQLALTPSTGTLLPRPEESVDWDTTRNLIIEGDNLEVLKLLQKSYAGKVKLIYIDPPYNTGREFIYSDDFRDNLRNYLDLSSQSDATGRKLTSSAEGSGRYHTNWLSMLYPRLKLARALMREDGVLFVSIDDHEIHNLRTLLDEVLGPENFVATLIWQKVYAPKNTARHFSEDHDYIVCYARNAELWKPTLLARSDEANARYTNPDNDPRGPWKSSDLTARNYYSQGQYEVVSPTGKRFKSGVGRYWRTSHDGFLELERDNRVWWGADGNNMPAEKRFLSEVQQGMTPQTLLMYKDVGHTQEAKKEFLEFVPVTETENVLNSVKPSRLIRRLLQVGTDPDGDAVVLDFFAGSGSTAHAVLAQNAADGGSRAFICVQFPEPLPKREPGFATIADLTRARARNVAAKLTEQDHQTLPLGERRAHDRGFRSFRLSDSCIRQWSPNRDTLANSLLDHADHLAPGRTEQDVLYELLLKLGLDLTVPIEQRTIAGRTVHSVGGGVLLVCLAEQVARDEVEPLALGIAEWHRELAPAGEAQVVVRDSAFADDVAKTNLVAILQQHGLENVRSL